MVLSNIYQLNIVKRGVKLKIIVFIVVQVRF